MAEKTTKRGLAAANKKTREEVSRKGGEASHDSRGNKENNDKGFLGNVGEKASEAWDATKDKVKDVID